MRDYEELVKALRETRETVRENPGLAMRVSPYQLSAAADAIEELQKALDAVNDAHNEGYDVGYWAGRRDYEPKWISVEERLPECDLGAEVGNIEWISYGMVHAGCFGRGGKYRDAYFRTWTDEEEGVDAKDVDYWRSVTLQEPPKEEK